MFKSSESFDVKQTIYDDILKESVDAIQQLRDELKADPVINLFDFCCFSSCLS